MQKVKSKGKGEYVAWEDACVCVCVFLQRERENER